MKGLGGRWLPDQRHHFQTPVYALQRRQDGAKQSGSERQTKWSASHRNICCTNLLNESCALGVLPLGPSPRTPAELRLCTPLGKAREGGATLRNVFGPSDCCFAPPSAAAAWGWGGKGVSIVGSYSFQTVVILTISWGKMGQKCFK